MPQVAAVTSYGIILPCNRFCEGDTWVEGLIGWSVGWARINLDVSIMLQKVLGLGGAG